MGFRVKPNALDLRPELYAPDPWIVSGVLQSYCRSLKGYHYKEEYILESFREVGSNFSGPPVIKPFTSLQRTL